MTVASRLKGQHIGMLLIVKKMPSVEGRTEWLCQCTVCGRECTLDSQDIRRKGHCGCCHHPTRKRIPKHLPPSRVGCRIKTVYLQGVANTKSSWRSMLQRAGLQNIPVDAEWRSFAAFYADMGARPNDDVLSRKELKGIFGPGNCVWLTKGELRRLRAVLKKSGETHSATDFVVDGQFDWAKWRASGSPEYAAA